MRKQQILLTTDAVVFDFRPVVAKLLLVQRKNPPFENMWALPGGFLEEEEPLVDGALRELHEETGLELGELQQIGAFGAPGRDPRGRTVTVAFWGSIRENMEIKAADDAVDAKWFPVNELPELAFDHREIISKAFEIAIADRKQD